MQTQPGRRLWVQVDLSRLFFIDQITFHASFTCLRLFLYGTRIALDSNDDNLAAKISGDDLSLFAPCVNDQPNVRAGISKNLRFLLFCGSSADPATLRIDQLAIFGRPVTQPVPLTFE